MDLELIFSEESEPFAGQLLVIDADTDTSPERRERSRSRQISFPPEEELEIVELIAPCYQHRHAVSAAAKISAARCLQLLVQNDGKEVQRSATVQADSDAAGVAASSWSTSSSSSSTGAGHRHRTHKFLTCIAAATLPSTPQLTQPPQPP